MTASRTTSATGEKSGGANMTDSEVRTLLETWRERATDAKKAASHDAAMHSTNSYARNMVRAQVLEQCANELSAALDVSCGGTLEKKKEHDYTRVDESC